MDTTTERSYGTTAERAFLDQLAQSKAAPILLSNYVAAAQRRAVWGQINKTEVLLYAQMLLGNAQQQAVDGNRVRRAS